MALEQGSRSPARRSSAATLTHGDARNNGGPGLRDRDERGGARSRGLSCLSQKTQGDGDSRGGTPTSGRHGQNLILAVIGRIGTAGVLNCRRVPGEAVRGLSMEGRMTLRNMAIEAGTPSGMVAPLKTFQYLKKFPFPPRGGLERGRRVVASAPDRSGTEQSDRGSSSGRRRSLPRSRGGRARRWSCRSTAESPTRPRRKIPSDAPR